MYLFEEKIIWKCYKIFSGEYIDLVGDYCYKGALGRDFWKGKIRKGFYKSL